MKVALFLYALKSGGTERRLLRFADKLDVDGRILTVLAAEDTLSAEWPADTLSFPASEIHNKRRFLYEIACALWGLWRWLRRERPDTLLCAIPTCNVMGALIGRLAGVPRIIVSHTTDGHFGGRVMCWLEGLAWWLADDILANSYMVAKAAYKKHPVASRRRPALRWEWGLRPKVRVVYAGIETAQFLECKTNTGPPVVGLFANGFEYKRWDRFFDLARRIPEARFIVGGRQHQDFDLPQNAEILGEVDATWFYNQISVLVLCSDCEGMANVWIEAMAAGVPVVTRNVGGASELIRHGREGYLVENDANMEAAVRALLADEGLAAQMGASGRERAKRFDMSVSMAEMRAFLRTDMEAKSW